MTKDEIIAAARAITDLDTTDVSATQADLYLLDGFNRIVEMERAWPFYEQTASVSTVVGQRDYPMSAISSGSFREITSVVDTTTAGRRLTWVNYDEAEEVWLGGSDTNGRPLYFSLWAQAINIWPKPAAIYTLSVRGYRKPTTWTATGAVQADCDDRLHMALVYFVASEMFRFQTDLEVANSYRKQFEEAAGMARADIMRTPQAYPLILSNGGAISRRTGPTLGPSPSWGQ